MVVNVWISAVTTDTLSRKEAVAWINDTLKSHFTKVEELSTGAAYCQLTHILFPESINLKKVKFNPRSEPDILSNWKVLTTSWKKLGVDKPVDVEKLKKGKFQDNMEFLQWFYKFFNANISENCYEYDAVDARGGEDLPALKGPGGAPKPSVSRPTAPLAKSVPVSRLVRPSAAPSTAKSSPPVVQPDASLMRENQDLRNQLDERNNELKIWIQNAKEMENERNHYYGMLLKLESMMCELEKTGSSSVEISEIKNVLYAVSEEDVDGEVGEVADLKSNGAVQANVSDVVDDPETF